MEQSKMPRQVKAHKLTTTKVITFNGYGVDNKVKQAINEGKTNIR